MEEHVILIARCMASIRRFFIELLITVVPAVVLSLFVNVYVAGATIVDGPSMQPNLYSDYRVMTEKVSYHLHPPRRGDVVVVERPDGETPLVKRVLALPGEIVEVRGGHVYINHTPIQEPWVTYWGGQDYPATLVPVDHVFVLGDNRAVSRDSREIGPVPYDRVHRHVVFIFWPLNEIKFLP
jgi:signal peptidase I